MLEKTIISLKRTSLREPMLRLISALFLFHGVSIVAFCQVATATTDMTAATVTPSAEEISRMIQSSDTENQLETSKTPAFHLKASFETFDYLGKPDGSGTVESFWDGTSRFRRVVTYRDHARTEIHTEKSVYLQGQGFTSSLSMNRLISGFFYPLPNPTQMAHSDLSYKPITVSGVSMDCVIVSPKPLPGASASFQQNVYCLTKDSHILRLAQMSQHMILGYNDLTMFHGRSVPRSLMLMQGPIVRGRMHIEEISDWSSPDNDMFRVPEGSDELVSTARVGSGVVQGLAIKQPAPNYPMHARLAHITGNVVLHALISRSGDISDLEIVSSPDPYLADAAMSAVRYWKYKPYLLNGQPVEVDTMITVNFNIN
jgi:TonB family protein